MSKRLTLLIVALISLVGCSVFSSKPLVPEQLLLLPPNEGPHGQVLKQKVTMTAKGEQHQFIVVIRLEQDLLKLRALLPTGQAVLSIDYDGNELIQHNYASQALPSEDILAMMQFALWPKESIEKYYSIDNGWQLNVKSNQRILQTTKGKMLSVDYVSSDEMKLENYRYHYQIAVETLEKINL